MRTHFRAFEDPKSLFSLKCEMVIKKRVFTTLHISWQKLTCSFWYDCYTYHFPGDACTTRCCWIFLYFFIYGRGTHFQIPWYITFGEDEAFCVKWGLNEDHFSSLVLMRTKSSIEDLFGRTASGSKRREKVSRNGRNDKKCLEIGKKLFLPFLDTFQKCL